MRYTLSKQANANRHPDSGVEVERGPRIRATYYKAMLDHMLPSTQFTQPVLDNNRYPDAKM